MFCANKILNSSTLGLYGTGGTGTIFNGQVPVYTVPDKYLHEKKNLYVSILGLHGTGETGRSFKWLSVQKQVPNLHNKPFQNS